MFKKLAGPVVCLVLLGASPVAKADLFQNFNYSWGNQSTGIGQGENSPEMTLVGDSFLFGGLDAEGAKLAALNSSGSTMAGVLPGDTPLLLASADTQPTVPVYDAAKLTTAGYPAGHDVIAAAWADSTPGVLHVRVIDGSTAAPRFANQSFDLALGGNQPPVPVAVRFTQDADGRFLVAAAAVQLDGTVTSRRWTVASIVPGALAPGSAGTPALDGGFGTAGIARGPYTAGGGSLEAMDLTGGGQAILSGTADFTGSDLVPTRLHVLKLTASGQPDLTFATNGLYTTDAMADGDAQPTALPPLAQTGSDIEVAPTGDVLIAGSEADPEQEDPDNWVEYTGQGFLIRLTPDGAPRESFGSGGVVTFEEHNAQEIALTEEGTAYVLAGAFPDTFGAEMYAYDTFGTLLMNRGVSRADGDECLYYPRAMQLLPDDSGDSLVFAGQCPDTFGGPSLSSMAYTDEASVRRVRVNVVPGTANVSGTSVPLDEAARPDPDTPAQIEVGGTIAATPMRSSPMRSSPMRSSPIQSSPMRSSPMRSSPMRSSPMRSSPLSSLPMRSSGGWAEVLKNTPLADRPLQSVTLGDVLDLNPVPTFYIGDLDPTGPALRRTSVAALMLLGRPLDVLPAPTSAGWCAYLAAAGPKPHCGDDGVDPAETHPFDLELRGADLGTYWHSVPIPLTQSVLGSGDDRAPLAYIPLNSIDLSATPLGDISESDVADLISCESACEGTLGERQDADETRYGDVSLGDLLAALQVGGHVYTLQQLLPGIVPADELSPEESAALDALIHRAASNGGRQAVGMTFVYSCEFGSGVVKASIDARGMGYVPDSGVLHARGGEWQLVDPAVSGDTLTFSKLRKADGTVDDLDFPCNLLGEGERGVTFSIEFHADPPTRLGSVKLAPSVDVGAGADVQGTPSFLDIVDSNDPPGDASTTRVLAPDNLYTGYIAPGGDADAFRIHAPAAGSVVTVSVSQPPADFDLYVQGPPAGIPVPPSRLRAASTSALADPPLPDQTGDLNGDDETPGADGLATGPIRASSLATLPLRGTSARNGTADESVSFLVQDGDVGKDFLATVAGNAGATSDDAYGLRVTVTPPAAEPDCIANRTGLSSAAPGTFPGTVPSNTQTLILWDRQRTEGAYPGTSATLAAKLASLATAPGVNGLVVPVESDPTHGVDVRAAFASWDADPCSPGAANDVVAAINQVVDGLRPSLPQLRHVVIVGGDNLIPQARVPDLVGIGNERQEADQTTANGLDTPISRALRRGEVLTDDPYGDFDPKAWLDGTLAVPDVALGRLVETPGEIGTQIDQYISRGGVMPATSARVTGYDFVTDGAQSILGGLTTLLGGSGNIASRIDETWTAADALSYINRPGGGITSINGHYDNYRALPAATSAGTSTDLLLAASADPASGSLFFTVGCHAGLQAIDAYAGGVGPGLTDWAQRLTRGGSEFVGNTGFGYGDTNSVAYSERLMAGFSAQLATRAVTAGQALMYAKQLYFATLAVPGVYDGKVLGEATFYGLPMYRVGATGGLGASALPDADPTGATNLQSSPFSVNPVLTEVPTDRGRYWTADGRDPIVSHFRPIQPRTELDVTPADSGIVHGALIESLISHDVTDVDPVYARPTVDLSANEPELATQDAGFPAVLQRLEPFSAADGRHTKLNLAAGQFIGNPGDRTGRGTQRLFTKIAGTVLRSRSADFDPPRITDVNSVITANGLAAFTVTTPDTDATRGVLLYLVPGSGGVWQSAPLVRSGDHFTASVSVASGTQLVTAFAELVDGAGNVSMATDKVRGFEATVTAPPSEGAPQLAVTPAPSASGYYTGPTDVAVTDESRRHATVSVDGGASVPYTGPIHLTTDGVHTVVVTSESGVQATAIVPIDATPPAAPLLTSTVPASPSTNTSPLIVGSAEAATTVRLYKSTACTGTPVATGTSADLVAGFPQAVPANSTTTFTATATDTAGNTSACSTPLVYASTPPTPAVPVVSSTNPASPSNVATPSVRGTAAAGSTVRIYATPSCTGTPLATGTAAAFNSTGIPVTVTQNAVTTLRATAAFGAGVPSACSSTSVAYMHDSIVPGTNGATQISPLTRVYTGQATDNLSGVASVQATITPTLGAARVVNATLSCTPDKRTCNWTVTSPIGGLVTLRAVATDYAGNRDPVGVTRTALLGLL